MEKVIFSKIKSATEIAELQVRKGAFVWKYVKRDGLYANKYTFYQLILFLSSKFLGAFTVTVTNHTMIINMC